MSTKFFHFVQAVLKMANPQVSVQPSDLIISSVIETATALSGQKSKAEKTRKDKGRKKKKKAERRRNDVRAEGRKSRRKEKQGAEAAQPQL